MTAPRQERDGLDRRNVTLGLLATGVAGGWGSRAACAATTERVVADRFTGLAIGGVDPVAYFTDGRMLAGRADFEVSAEGAVWRFRNAGNRAFFVARPDIYGPQFGGYDPVDVARGVPVAGRPQVWMIAGERLYLFARLESHDAFAADPVAVLDAARRRWPQLRETLAQY